jgi:hypothetical protein
MLAYAKAGYLACSNSARLPGKDAGQSCRAKLSGKAAGHGCWARLPGKSAAAGQSCRARLPGKVMTFPSSFEAKKIPIFSSSN